MRLNRSEPCVSRLPALNLPRILILSAFAGSGHMSAALAVKKSLLERRPDLSIDILDAYTEKSRLLGQLATTGYIQSVKYMPQLYGYLYERKSSGKSMNLMKKTVLRWTAEKIKRRFKNDPPNLLVSTHAFASGVAALLKEDWNIPTVSVVTDFVVHPFWIHENTDLFLVGSEGLSHHLIEKGVNRKRIRVTGIPVDTQFRVHEDKRAAREHLGLSFHIKTILLMGGGAGLGPLPSILRSLRSMSTPTQVLVVAGVNRRLRKKMERLAKRILSKKSRPRHHIQDVRVYGYVENVHEFMSASDLLITKPGGLTTSEALASELPLLIVKPIPGQEVRNARYLVHEKAAVMANHENEVAEIAQALLNDPAQLKALQERSRKLKKPDSSRAAAREILHLLRIRQLF